MPLWALGGCGGWECGGVMGRRGKRVGWKKKSADSSPSMQTNHFEMPKTSTKVITHDVSDLTKKSLSTFWNHYLFDQNMKDIKTATFLKWLNIWAGGYENNMDRQQWYHSAPPATLACKMECMKTAVTHWAWHDAFWFMFSCSSASSLSAFSAAVFSCQAIFVFLRFFSANNFHYQQHKV